MNELVIYGSQPSQDSSSKHGVLSVCDLYTGLSQRHPLNHINIPQGQTLASAGGLVFAIQSDSPTLKAYTSDGEIAHSIELEEPLASIHVSPLGTWLAGGSSKSGLVYLWELASGTLMGVLDRSSAPVSFIKFTEDETFLFTAFRDGSLLGWRLIDLVSTPLENKPSLKIQPVFTWSGTHSSEITGLNVGYGQGLDNRVYSSSTDKTLRVWDLTDDGLVCTYIVASEVTALALDPAERVLYAGFENGDVLAIDRFKVNPTTGLVEAPQYNSNHIAVESDESNTFYRADGSKKSIVSLDISYDGSILVAGYSDGHVYSYDTSTRQMLVQFPSLEPAAVGSLQIYRHQSQQKRKPVLSTAPAYDTTSHNVWLKVADTLPVEANCDIERARLQAGTFLTGNSDESLRARVLELQAEISRVKESHSELSKVHQELWKLHTKKVDT